MDWIFNNFEIVALVVLALGSAVKQFVESARSKRDEQPRRDEQEEDDTTWFPIPIPPEYLPKAPPPLPGAYPPPPLYKAQPPPLAIDTDEVLRRQTEMQEKLRDHRENKAKIKAKAKEAQPRIGQLKRPANPPATTGIHATLRNPSSTRQAVVLREILGPPVGMR